MGAFCSASAHSVAAELRFDCIKDQRFLALFSVEGFTVEALLLGVFFVESKLLINTINAT
jgi:hypothetical protein